MQDRPIDRVMLQASRDLTDEEKRDWVTWATPEQVRRIAGTTGLPGDLIEAFAFHEDFLVRRVIAGDGRVQGEIRHRALMTEKSAAMLRIWISGSQTVSAEEALELVQRALEFKQEYMAAVFGEFYLKLGLQNMPEEFAKIINKQFGYFREREWIEVVNQLNALGKENHHLIDAQKALIWAQASPNQSAVVTLLRTMNASSALWEEVAKFGINNQPWARWCIFEAARDILSQRLEVPLSAETLGKIADWTGYDTVKYRLVGVEDLGKFGPTKIGAVSEEELSRGREELQELLNRPDVLTFVAKDIWKILADRKELRDWILTEGLDIAARSNNAGYWKDTVESGLTKKEKRDLLQYAANTGRRGGETEREKEAELACDIYALDEVLVMLQEEAELDKPLRAAWRKLQEVAVAMQLSYRGQLLDGPLARRWPEETNIALMRGHNWPDCPGNTWLAKQIASAASEESRMFIARMLHHWEESAGELVATSSGVAVRKAPLTAARSGKDKNGPQTSI